MPVERMRMRPWLEEQINQGRIQGLKWVNKEMKIFQIPWMHAARHGWDVEKDAPLFRNWAIHTGKYQPGVDKPDPKTWKANFRCAMNSLPDIEEVKDKSMKKGTNAFRVYKMLSESERPKKKAKRKFDKDEKIKVERRVSSRSSANGQAASSPPVKVESVDVADSTMHAEQSECAISTVEDTGSELQRSANRSILGDHMIISDLPDVCQTIEVITENEEQSVSSSHPYPLQISPVSSYGESDTDSVNSDDDSKEVGRLFPSGRLSFTPSVLKNPIGTLPGMATFVTSPKTNFRVISNQEESPLIAYDNSSLNPLLQAMQPPPGPAPSSSPAPEGRASVIMKTADVSTVKSC